MCYSLKGNYKKKKKKKKKEEDENLYMASNFK